MNKLTEVFWSSFVKPGAAQTNERLQNYREGEAAGRYGTGHDDDERFNPDG